MTKGKEKLQETWRRFRMRSPEDRRLILRATWVMPLTRIGLRLFGFWRWKELIERFLLSTRFPRPLPASAENQSVLRTVRAVRSVELHGLTDPNCLERSMTLWWMLRREGIEGELHIGARKQDGSFKAHAWVELRGQVLNDDVEVYRHYARFDAPIAATVSGKNVTKTEVR
jgi:hypothetical protein